MNWIEQKWSLFLQVGKDEIPPSEFIRVKQSKPEYVEEFTVQNSLW